MFFIVSKVLGNLFEPINFMAFCLLAGVILRFVGFRRSSVTLIGFVAIALPILCFSPLNSLLIRALEDRFPHAAADLPAPTGIIVLGGSIDPEVSASRNEIAIEHAASRLTAGAILARRFPNARLVFTGGPADLRSESHDEAEGVRLLWLSLGIPESQMTFEKKSRNTYENAIFTRDLIAPKPGETWLLVTSATHMPRSVGIFRKAGFPVVPYPVDYITYGTSRDWRITTVGIRSLDHMDISFHEWVGLVGYWLTGKTDALFPAP